MARSRIRGRAPRSYGGRVQLARPEQSLTLDARSPLLQDFHVDYLAFGHHWKSTLTLQGLNLQKALETSTAFTNASALPNDLRLTGLVDLSLKAGGRKMPQTLAEAPRFITSLRWQATHGKILFKEDQIPWSTHGNLENRDDVFSLEKSAFHLGQFSGGLSGILKPAGASSQFQLQMHGNPDTDIDTLMRLIRLPHILQGTGDFVLRINGSLKEWRLTTQAILPRAQLWNYPVTYVWRWRATPRGRLGIAGQQFPAGSDGPYPDAGNALCRWAFAACHHRGCFDKRVSSRGARRLFIRRRRHGWRLGRLAIARLLVAFASGLERCGGEPGLARRL